MDNYTLLLIKEDKSKTDITRYINNLSWNDSLDTLGVQVTFDYARNEKDLVTIGDKLILTNNSEEIFRGIITDVTWNRYSKGIIAFDYAIYLNKSKTIVQFKEVSVTAAIKELCRKFNVSISNISSISTKVTKIYKDNTIAEIIKDLLFQAETETGTKYRLEMDKGQLVIEEYKEISIDPTYQLTENGQPFKILDVPGNINKSESIQDMKNSVLVSSQNEKESRIMELVEDDESIAKYGLLKEVLILQDQDESQVYNAAKVKLKEANQVQEDISIELLGNDMLKSGRIITVKNDSYDLDGKFLIKSTNHTYSKRIHKTNITVKEVE